MIGNIKNLKLFLNSRAVFTPSLKGQGYKPRVTGFTLLELLVAVAIFSSMVFILANIYLLSLKAQRHSAFSQKVLSQTRYLIESMSRQIRSGQIDYGYYGGEIINFPENTLALKNQEDESIVYRLDSNSGEIFIQTQEGQAKLTSAAEFEVIYLNFYIIPQTNPFLNQQCQNNDQCPFSQCQFGWCLTPEIHPLVTINLALRIKAPKLEEQKVVYFQTTISNRIYKK